MILISALRARGYDNLIDVAGGLTAMKKSGKFETTKFECTEKMKEVWSGFQMPNSFAQ